ncbi:PLP-dependent aminotransferase family protein [Streptomyces alfalfae]|nr:PLP-dependent aminotransferase family protein [Streptomyces fradiae]RXX47208.1 PLP-dependent aminotransferase family protein [Streptomyces alfalfae]RZM85976.1 PLP-dependent aminotransferase family protein [Streptomyces alfalfae]
MVRGSWGGLAVPHLQISIDRDSSRQLAGQIRDSVKGAIERRRLAPGTRLPSTRQLAADLGVSRSVAVEAYEQLCAEGYLRARRGAGTVVADVDTGGGSPVTSPLIAGADGRPGLLDLRTGATDVSLFPRREWLAAVSDAIGNASLRDLGYAPPSGLPQTRQVLAGYLGRVCAVEAAPECVTLTAGFAQGLSLLCQTLLRRGIRELAVEEPGHPGQRAFIASLGMTPVSAPVDEHGLRVDALARTGARAVLVTPACQFPTGARMSPERRQALVAWAREVDGLVIEDDFDGALAFGQRPPALQSLAPERVVYAGSASKTLAPGLRLGWLVVPSAVLPGVEAVRATVDLGLSTIDQLALARFIENGQLDRHVRALRAHLRRRQEAFESALHDHLPPARVANVAAGLQTYVRLPPGLDEAQMVGAAFRRNVLVWGGAHYRHDADATHAPALVVNHAGTTMSRLVEAAQHLGAAYLDCAADPPARRERPARPVRAGRARSRAQFLAHCD